MQPENQETTIHNYTNDRSSVVTGRFEIKRETELIKWYEGCRCSVIKMVLGSLTLFPHTECNIEVIPYYQERLSANKSNNLEKPLLAKIFNFANRGCVRQRKSGMVQNLELCPRGTTCK
jgi:hypothetical protein